MTEGPLPGGSESSDLDTLPTLVARVREAALWADRSFTLDDPASSLRRLPGPASENLNAGYRSQISAVLGQRAEAANSLGLEGPPGASLPLPSGRILSLMPDETLSDGAAADETDGFFDSDNFPAWDTWIALVALTAKFSDRDAPVRAGQCDVHLLAWIPEALTDAVERGISVNPEGCLRWLDEIDPELASLLTGA